MAISTKKRSLQEKIPEIMSFIVYVIVSFIIGSLIIPYCEPFTGDGIDVREAYKPIIVVFVLIAAVGGPLGFVYRNRLSGVASAIIMGLGTGLGFFTIYALATNLECTENILVI